MVLVNDGGLGARRRKESCLSTVPKGSLESRLGSGLAVAT